MVESLYELLQPYLAGSSATDGPAPVPFVGSSTISRYLFRLTTLPLGAISTTEPQALSQAAYSSDLSLQALASRSHKAAIRSSDSLSTLNTSIPDLTASARTLHDAIPFLDQAAFSFSTKYSKANSENAVLDRRKEAMLLSRNVDRVSELLELPTLLSSTISSASANTSGTGTNYSQALDLFAHIKRLSLLHPDSAIVKSVLAEAEEAIKDMTSNLITSLRGPNIRLAAAIRTIGWLRRVAPDLIYPTPISPSTSKPTSLTNPAPPSEGLFGSLFLTARLAHLLHLLSALQPLADLADQETARRLPPQQLMQPSSTRKASYSAAASGTHSERYLKRYVEIFREQSFATVSMYRNVFPPSPSTPQPSQENSTSLLHPLPTALTTFPMHLVDLLMDTLRTYLPNVTDPSARESLLTQVLYAAGSLGRLGADFGLMIALLEDEDEVDEAGFADKNVQMNGDGVNGGAGEGQQTPESAAPETLEWVRVMKKHRIQAGRLEALAASHETRIE